MQWLLEMGARADILSLAGESSIDVARRFGQLAVLKALGVRDEDMPISARALLRSHSRVEYEYHGATRFYSHSYE